LTGSAEWRLFTAAGCEQGGKPCEYNTTTNEAHWSWPAPAPSAASASAASFAASFAAPPAASFAAASDQHLAAEGLRLQLYDKTSTGYQSVHADGARARSGRYEARHYESLDYSATAVEVAVAAGRRPGGGAGLSSAAQERRDERRSQACSPHAPEAQGVGRLSQEQPTNGVAEHGGATSASLSPRGAQDGHDEPRRRPTAGRHALPTSSASPPLGPHPPCRALAAAAVSAPRRALAPSRSEAALEVKRKKVRTLLEGDLVFVDWPRLPDIVSPATPAGLPAFIVSWEIVRMDVPAAAGESSPFDVRVAPWSRDGLAADPATHIVVPRNHLINFHAGFRPAWAAGGARAPHESLLDAIEYKVEFRRRRKPAYPGAEKMWREVMGEAPLPARFGGAGEGSGR